MRFKKCNQTKHINSKSNNFVKEATLFEPVLLKNNLKG
jgi:hypothetical protein